MSLEVSDSAVERQASRQRSALGLIAWFFGGWRFPVVAMSLLVGFALMVLMVALAPDGVEGFAGFAAEFKRWCFGWDGVSSVSPVQVAFMVSELLVFAAVLLFIWWGPLVRAWREERRGLGLTAGLGLALLSGALVLLVQVSAPGAVADVRDVRALRTERAAPALRLTDQSGAVVDLAELRGRVVLVTAVYSTCGSTCPMLLGQAKRAVATVAGTLPDALVDELRVLTITLDPAHDTREVRALAAENQGVETPPWHLLGGEVAEVEAALDRWEIARRRDPETGQIAHANLFMLVDRQGRLAYRLGLSEEREAWLAEALLELLREPPDRP